MWKNFRRQIIIGVTLSFVALFGFSFILFQVNSEPDIENLIQQLKDQENWSIRKEAAILLGQRGEKASKAVPVLLETLKDSDEDVRQTAMEALKEIAPRSQKFLTVLVQISQADENRDIRNKANEYLAELRLPEKPDVEQMRKAKKAFLTAKEKKEKEKVSSLFLESIDSSDFEVRQTGIDKFLEIVNQPEEYLPLLFQALNHQSQSVRYGAIEAFGKLGVDADFFTNGKVSKELKKLFIDPDEGIRYRAAWATCKITKKGDDGIPVLVDCLEKTQKEKKVLTYLFTNSFLYSNTPEAFEQAKRVIPYLIRLLEDPEKEVRYNATIALGEFGSSAKEAISALKECLKSNPQKISFIAVEASLRKIDGKREEYFTFTQSYYIHVRQMIGLGKLSEAEKMCNDILQLDPQLARFYVARGTIHSIQGDSGKAWRDAALAIEKDPKDLETAQAFNVRGLIHLQRNNIDKAFDDGNQSIRLNPNNATGYYLRGSARIGMDDFDGALSDAEKSIELEPNLFPSYYLQGSSYYQKQEKEKAKKAYQNFLLYSAKETDFGTIKMKENVFKMFPELKNK